MTSYFTISPEDFDNICYASSIYMYVWRNCGFFFADPNKFVISL